MENIDQLPQHIITALEQNEESVYQIMQNNQISIDTQIKVIRSLYLDPRFVARGVNNSRLTHLLTAIIEKFVDNSQFDELGLNEKLDQLNQNTKPHTDKLIQRLIDSGTVQNVQLAEKIAKTHLSGLSCITTDDLLVRTQRVLGYLVYEHKILQQKHRYKSDKINVDKNYILTQVIDEFEKRIDNGTLSKNQFTRLLFLCSEGHRREVLYFRLFRHFSPAVIKFIEQNFIQSNTSPVDLWRIAYSYAMDNHEQDMRIVFSNFLHNIIDKIAQDEVLFNEKYLNRDSLKNVVRSMGSLLISSESVLKILKHFNQSILQEIKVCNSEPYQVLKLIEQISVFIQTSVNLRHFTSFEYEKEIQPMLEFVRNTVNYQDAKSLFQFLSVLKGLAKQEFYVDNGKLLDVWSLFLKNGLTDGIKSNLKCLGQYTYVSQLVSADLSSQVEQPEINDLATIRKIKASNQNNDYNLHNQVKRMLKDLAIEFQEEVQIGVLSVDFVLPKYQIAIELDGPSHFLILKNGQLQLSGTSLAKQRILRKTGQFKQIFQAVGNLAQSDVQTVEQVIEKISELVNK